MSTSSINSGSTVASTSAATSNASSTLAAAGGGSAIVLRMLKSIIPLLLDSQNEQASNLRELQDNFLNLGTGSAASKALSGVMEGVGTGAQGGSQVYAGSKGLSDLRGITTKQTDIEKGLKDLEAHQGPAAGMVAEPGRPGPGPAAAPANPRLTDQQAAVKREGFHAQSKGLEVEMQKVRASMQQTEGWGSGISAVGKAGATAAGYAADMQQAHATSTKALVDGQSSLVNQTQSTTAKLADVAQAAGQAAKAFSK